MTHSLVLTTTVLAATPSVWRAPDGYMPAMELQGMMDGKPVVLKRQVFGPQSDVGLGRAHVSTVTGRDGTLMGFTRMDPVLADRRLPTASEAKLAAEAFLRTAAPDLLARYEVNWIKQHDETIVHNEQKVSIPGMKVKCRNLVDGKYFWVVVGADLELVTFERDIIWNFSTGYRQTEKWLHDTWLAETGRRFGS